MPNCAPRPLLKCGSCKFARYCNKDCQKAAWECHKPECAAIKRVYPNKASDQTRLVARLFWRKQRKEKNCVKEDVPVTVEVGYLAMKYRPNRELKSSQKLFRNCNLTYTTERRKKNNSLMTEFSALEITSRTRRCPTMTKLFITGSER